MKLLVVAFTLLFAIPSFASFACYRSGKNYYCPTSEGVVWCYPSGEQYYCPTDEGVVWCYKTKRSDGSTTHYCPTSSGNWIFVD